MQREKYYTLPEIWDLCLDKIYDKDQYVKDFVEFMLANGISKGSTILDAGCGSGFPALDLIKNGFNVTGTDKSDEMIRQLRLNAGKNGLRINAHNISWYDLSSRFRDAFDFVYCRGNSLIYAASWERNWMVPQRNREEVFTALENFYSVLKKNGKLYVDVTNEKEKPHKTTLGTVDTPGGQIELLWEFKHDILNRTRLWIMNIRYKNTGKVREYKSYSYLLKKNELSQMLHKIGFRRIKKVKIDSEKNYTCYLAEKIFIRDSETISSPHTLLFS